MEMLERSREVGVMAVWSSRGRLLSLVNVPFLCKLKRVKCYYFNKLSMKAKGLK